MDSFKVTGTYPTEHHMEASYAGIEQELYMGYKIMWLLARNGSQVPDLAGDPDEPGTYRNRQRWIPQAWEDAKRQAKDVLETTPLSHSGDSASAMFEGEASPFVEEKGMGVGGGEGNGLVYDLHSVVIHRGSAYSGHYHAFIRDCQNEVSKSVMLYTLEVSRFTDVYFLGEVTPCRKFGFPVSEWCVSFNRGFYGEVCLYALP